MSIIRKTPKEKYVNHNYVKTHEIVLISEEFYTTAGEDFLIVSDKHFTKIKLDSITTDRISVKALSTCLILPDQNKIDNEYDEILMKKGTCIQFYNALGIWYILSSDGLKNG